MRAGHAGPDAGEGWRRAPRGSAWRIVRHGMLGASLALCGVGAASAVEWPAVGRLETAGRADFCTGTLIAPDLVATAAHCLFRRGGVVRPEDLTFRAGLGTGATATRHGRRLMLHPDYARRPGGAERLAVDLALVGLDAPVDAALPVSFAPGPGDAVTLVFYRNDRGEAVVEERGCPVLRRAGALLLIACEVAGGASGGAVIVPGAGTGADSAVATIVARSSSAGVGLAHAVTFDGALATLRAAWDMEN